MKTAEELDQLAVEYLESIGIKTKEEFAERFDEHPYRPMALFAFHVQQGMLNRQYFTKTDVLNIVRDSLNFVKNSSIEKTLREAGLQCDAIREKQFTKDNK